MAAVGVPFITNALPGAQIFTLPPPVIVPLSVNVICTCTIVSFYGYDTTSTYRLAAVYDYSW